MIYFYSKYRMVSRRCTKMGAIFVFSSRRLLPVHPLILSSTPVKCAFSVARVLSILLTSHGEKCDITFVGKGADRPSRCQTFFLTHLPLVLQPPTYGVSIYRCSSDQSLFVHMLSHGSFDSLGNQRKFLCHVERDVIYSFEVGLSLAIGFVFYLNNAR